MINRPSFIRYGGLLPVFAVLNACSMLSQNPAPVVQGVGAYLSSGYPPAYSGQQPPYGLPAPAVPQPAVPTVAQITAPLKSALTAPVAAPPVANPYSAAPAASVQPNPYAAPYAPAAAAPYAPPPPVAAPPVANPYPAAPAAPAQPNPYAAPYTPAAAAPYVPPPPVVAPPVANPYPTAPAAPVQPNPYAAPYTPAAAAPYVPPPVAAPPVANPYPAVPAASAQPNPYNNSSTPSYAPVDPAAARHTVVSGDTVYNIALRYRISQADLRAWNGLSNDHIEKGQVLYVKAPAAATRSSAAGTSGRYTVMAGDTLSSIARRHNMTAAELMALNQLGNADHIRVGQVLRVRAARERTVSDASPRVEPSRAAAGQTTHNGSISLLRPIPGPVVTTFQQTGGSYVMLDAVPGQKVMAAADGRVIYRSLEYPGHQYGEMLVIQHAGQYVTAYSNIRDIQLTDGQTVRRGQVLGMVDNHPQHGSRLYFRLVHQGQGVDPVPYLSS